MYWVLALSVVVFPCCHHVVKPLSNITLRPLQDRDHNFCLSLFWNYWWPIMFIIYPFIGRIW
jgi:hypothetical protein